MGKSFVADGEELLDAVTGTDGGKFAVGGLQGAADLSLRSQSHHCRPRQIFHLHPLLQFANGVDVGLQGLVVGLMERKAFGRRLQPMKPLAQLGEVGLVGGEGLERLLRVVNWTGCPRCHRYWQSLAWLSPNRPKQRRQAKCFLPPVSAASLSDAVAPSSPRRLWGAVRVVAVERLAVWRVEALAVGTAERSRSEGRVLALAERR